MGAPRAKSGALQICECLCSGKSEWDKSMAESLKKDVHVLKMKHMRGKEELVPWILGRVFFFSPQQLKSLYFYLKCRVKLCRTL